MAIDRRGLEPLWCWFITLTYRNRVGCFVPDPEGAKHHLDVFLDRLERRYHDAGWIWKLEPQESGAPHFHLLQIGRRDLADDDVRWIAENWNEVVGGDEVHLAWHLGLLGNGNQPCVRPVESWERVVKYAGKYLGKVCASLPGWEWPGRFWGARSRENIPTSKVTIPISGKFGWKVQRVFRRWREHQPNGKIRLSDGSRVLRGRVKDFHEGGLAAWIGSARMDLMSGVRLGRRCEVRSYHCRRPVRGGGITVYLPMEEVERVLDWALQEMETSQGSVTACGGGIAQPGQVL